MPKNGERFSIPKQELTKDQFDELLEGQETRTAIESNLVTT